MLLWILFTFFCFTQSLRVQESPIPSFKLQTGHLGEDQLQLVVKGLNALGHRRVNETSSDWNILWSHDDPFDEQAPELTLKDNQQVNWFPFSSQLTYKPFLAKNLQQMTKKFGKEEFGFHPRTFLPENFRSWDRMRKLDKGTKWIKKHRHSGDIHFIRTLKGIEEDQTDDYIIQELIHPWLFKSRKRDFGVFVAITSLNPPRIYVYPWMEEKMCRSPYNSDNLSDPGTFVTSGNESMQSFVHFSQLSRSISTKNIDAIWGSMKDIVVKTVLTAIHQQNIHNHSVQPERGFTSDSFFMLTRFDFLVDDRFKVWLIEVDANPDLTATSLAVLRRKSDLIYDFLQLATARHVEHEDVEGISYNLGDRMTAVRLLNMTCGNKCTDKDVSMISRVDYESKRQGEFERAFPSENFETYFPYMLSHREGMRQSHIIMRWHALQPHTKKTEPESEADLVQESVRLLLLIVASALVAAILFSIYLRCTRGKKKSE